jgi:hypothetical protein
MRVMVIVKATKEAEIRPLWEAEDFDPGIVEQVKAHREKIARLGK